MSPARSRASEHPRSTHGAVSVHADRRLGLLHENGITGITCRSWLSQRRRRVTFRRS
jgi:hypothetical protein